jgi:thymidylate kinase
MLISLRGTNGSGKSTVVKGLFDVTKPHKLLYGVLGPRLPEAYQITIKAKQPTFVLGPYITPCGGCDRLIPFDIIPPLIEKYAAKGHVIFEGVIVASIYGQIGRLMEKYKKNSIMLFLDTPMEECIKRVQSRRDDREDGREFDPKNLTTKFRACQRVREKVTADGIMRVEDAPSTTAHKKIISLIQHG